MTRTVRFLLFSLFFVVAGNSFAQSGARGIVINEIYIGTVRSFTANDSYIELYNPTTKPLYLDGCVLALFGATGGTEVSGSLTGITEAWKFPGKVGGQTMLVAPGQFTLIAPNARATSGGLDLSSADYETFTGIAILDPDNANAKNLAKLNAAQFTLDMNISQTHDAIVLADGSDTLTTDGLVISSVLDGVQYSTAGGVKLPASIDADITGGATLKLGIAMERKQKGITTHNSSNDFQLVPKPSPGYQHGSEPGKTPKAVELFPLNLGRYITYDSYATDSNGVIDIITKAYSSFEILKVNQSLGGFSNVAFAKDTADYTDFAVGSISDLHYRADGNGDIQVFADNSFLNTFIPAGLNILTPPDSFVNYLNLTTGFKKPYPIVHLNQTIDMSGITATIDVLSSGTFQGIDTVSVPAGKFDSAYVFAIKADVSVTVLGFPFASFGAKQTLWLVKGIGIVKRNSPSIAATGLTVPGSERQMRGYGVTTVGVAKEREAEKDGFTLASNPTRSEIHIISTVNNGLSGNVTMSLFDIAGRKIRSLYTGVSQGEYTFSMTDLTAGKYFIEISRDDEVPSMLSFVLIK